MTERQCPRCDADYAGWPALSRRDNATDICPECGIQEAMIDAGLVTRGTRVADVVLAREQRFREHLAKKEGKP